MWTPTVPGELCSYCLTGHEPGWIESDIDDPPDASAPAVVIELIRGERWRRRWFFAVLLIWGAAGAAMFARRSLVGVGLVMASGYVVTLTLALWRRVPAALASRVTWRLAPASWQPQPNRRGLFLVQLATGEAVLASASHRRMRSVSMTGMFWLGADQQRLRLVVPSEGGVMLSVLPKD